MQTTIAILKGFMTAEALLTNLRADGFSLSVTDGLLYVRPSASLTDEQRVLIRERKAELLALLAPKPCEKCGVAMTLVAVGYHSCPSCYFQTVEAKSGFWVTGVEEEMRAAA